MTNQYKKLPVIMKMWMQFNVMPRTGPQNTISKYSIVFAGCGVEKQMFPLEMLRPI